MKKKLNRKQKAELPPQHGIAGVKAMKLHSKTHRDRTKYTRKKKHKEIKDLEDYPPKADHVLSA